MSEKRYQTVLMSTDDIESLKKYQEKYGVNILSSLPTQPVSLPFSDTSEQVINLQEMTKLREDHEKLKKDFKHLESAFARLLETLNVTLNKMQSKIDRGYTEFRLEYKKDYFTNV